MRLTTGLGLLVLHLGALAAFIPHTFTWSALVVAAGLYHLTGGVGISLGFHRLLTHRSLQCPRWLEYVFAVCGTLALQGGPIEWVSTHRVHHANSDRDGDPHNVRRGLRWAHFEWLYLRNEARPDKSEQRRLAPDLFAIPFYCFLERTYVLWQVSLGLILFALGGWPWLIWGIFVRLVVTYHVTWLVNSAAHHAGYRTYRTGDRSTNNWWVALLTWGEGWHNNHHAFPFSARHGLHWFELDITWLTIRALQLLTVARRVRLPTPAMIARKLAYVEGGPTGAYMLPPAHLRAASQTREPGRSDALADARARRLSTAGSQREGPAIASSDCPAMPSVGTSRSTERLLDPERR